MLCAKKFNLSGWLSVLPLTRDQFDLSPQEFRDALVLHYRKPMLNFPGSCDGCGAIHLPLITLLTVIWWSGNLLAQ